MKNILLQIILFNAYSSVILLITALVTLNQKKIKQKFKIDHLLIHMGIYVCNFVFLSYQNKKSLPPYLLPIILTILMVIVIYFCQKISIIGLTGGIACGKSTVIEILKSKLDMPVIDCDIIARRVVEKGKPAYKQIVKLFSTDILQQEDNQIDRKKLGKIVFADRNLRRKLTKSHVILDAPLLFETKILEYFCFPILVVFVSDQQLQIKRLCERDGIDKEEAIQKIQAQMPIELKIKKADILLCNDTTKHQLEHEIFQKLTPYLLM